MLEERQTTTLKSQPIRFAWFHVTPGSARRVPIASASDAVLSFPWKERTFARIIISVCDFKRTLLKKITNHCFRIYIPNWWFRPITCFPFQCCINVSSKALLLYKYIIVSSLPLQPRSLSLMGLWDVFKSPLLWAIKPYHLQRYFKPITAFLRFVFQKQCRNCRILQAYHNKQTKNPLNKMVTMETLHSTPHTNRKQSLGSQRIRHRRVNCMIYC